VPLGYTRRMERRLNVFLSHASEDKAAAREIERRLREDGFEPWLDEKRLLPGQDWSLEIEKAVRQSDAIVVCISRTSLTKEGYLQRELRRALEVAEEKPDGTIFIIPVKLEQCEVPERIARWEWAAYYETDGYDRLTAALRLRASRLGIKPGPPARDGFRSRLLHRWPWVLLSVLVLGAVVTLRILTWPPKQRTISETAPPGMVAIAAGVLVMGRDHALFPVEGPPHEMAVQQYYIGRRLVSNAEYGSFVAATHRQPPPHWSHGVPPPGQETLPVTRVSWADAQAYCEAAGSRLPSEAEWEYAARGADSRLYPWGNEFNSKLVNSLESGVNRVTAPGRNQSPFGVEDLSGNVWQWCADDFKPYPGAHLAFQILEGAKVLRGGSFRSDRNHVTTTTRNLERPSARSDEIGFRCAR
jgi:formylglycine-generating enzyme required for sulfatase activity